MRLDRIAIGVIAVSLLAVSAGSAWQMVNTGREEASRKVSVIVNDSSLNRWATFNEGLRQGAADNNIQLNIVSTSVFSSMNSEKDIIEKEISNGAEALIIQIYSSYNQSEYLEKLSGEIPIVLVENDSDPEDVFSSVTPDNKAIGLELAKVISEKFGEGSGKRIGVLAGNQEQLAMFRRLEGLREGLKGTGVEIAWQSSGYSDTNLDIIIKNNQKSKYADAVVALGNGETEKAIDYYTQYTSCSENAVFGVGNSEKCLYYLDKGLIGDLLVMNEYDMGYYCIQAAGEQIQDVIGVQKHREIGYHVIDRENMYEPNNQLLLFPRKY